MTEPTRFDLSEVPGSRMLVEASAGTGKTHALSGLAVLLLGQGTLPPERLLVVTYTRAATAELRSRIRSTLRDVATHFDEPNPDPAIAPIIESLHKDDPAKARHSLGQALQRVDAITITTIHGFAQRALAAVGTTSGINPDLTVIGDDSQILNETAADELAIAAQRAQQALHPIDLPTFFKVKDTAGKLDSMPGLRLLPDIDLDDPTELFNDESTTSDELWAFLARRTAQAAAARRVQLGVRSYRELLSELCDALNTAVGDVVAKQLRQRYDVAMIDEFQDTDATQWEIFDRVFGCEGSRLILVGDPKQAIYRFSGADTNVFARAAGQPEMAKRSLDVNWRSDGAVLRGLEALWHGATFGSGVEFHPVATAPGFEGSRLVHSEGTTITPVEIALVDKDAFKANKNGYLGTSLSEEIIREWICAHVVDLLCNGQISLQDGSLRSVLPSDIALLVRSNSDSQPLASALAAVGVPAVVHSKDDVRVVSQSYFGKSSPSDAALEWTTLLHAVANPSNDGFLRAAAISIFGPVRDPFDLITTSESTFREFQERIARWAYVLTRIGVAEFVARVRSESGVIPRVLSAPNGDRLLTDVEHIGELFSELCGSGPTAPDQLLAALDSNVGLVSEDSEQLATRRIPTGAPAVTIMTVHKSKGLQFPIVGCVGLHKQAPTREYRFTDPSANQTVLDLTKAAASRSAAEQEEAEEGMRVLYVAMTRARHHVFTVWSHEQNSPRGPLTRLLAARDDTGVIDPARYGAPTINVGPAEEICSTLDPIAASVSGALAVRLITGRPQTEFFTPKEQADPIGYEPHSSANLQARTLDRALDRRTNRWSFSTITEQKHAAASTSTRPGTPGHDEGQDGDGANPSDSSANYLPNAQVSPLAWLPAGTSFGTLVHSVFEGVDFQADDLTAALGHTLDQELALQPVDLTPVRSSPDTAARNGHAMCVEGLKRALETPLGSMWDGKRLVDIRDIDRLSECHFTLHLQAPSPNAFTAASIGRLCLTHLDEEDPYRPWAVDLANGKIAVDLTGHLNGSIDLITRIGDGDEARFVVSDYKTNRLHEKGKAPQVDDYGPARLVDAMIAHDYPLQALLYSVALHRYLGFRMPNYDPAQNLGGITYLFVRGMTPEAPIAPDGTPNGVAQWAVPYQLIEAIDNGFRFGEAAS